MQATSRRAKRYKEPGSITMWIFLISLESLALDLFYRSEKSVQVTIFQIFISYPMNSSSLVQSTISFCNYCKPGLCRGLSVSIWAMYFLNLGTVPLLQTKTWLWILQLHCGQDNAGMVRSHAFHVGHSSMHVGQSSKIILCIFWTTLPAYLQSPQLWSASVKIDGAGEGWPDSARGMISVNSPKIHELQELQTNWWGHFFQYSFI